MEDQYQDRQRTEFDPTPIATEDEPAAADAQTTRGNRDWSQVRRRAEDPATMVHWVDEHGSIVRLISSRPSDR